MKKFSEYYTELTQSLKIGDIHIIFRNKDDYSGKFKTAKYLKDIENKIKDNEKWLKQAKNDVVEYTKEIKNAKKEYASIVDSKKQNLKKGAVIQKNIRPKLETFKQHLQTAIKKNATILSPFAISHIEFIFENVKQNKGTILTKITVNSNLAALSPSGKLKTKGDIEAFIKEKIKEKVGEGSPTENFMREILSGSGFSHGDISNKLYNTYIGWEKQGSKISLQTPIEFIIEVNFTITL